MDEGGVLIVSNRLPINLVEQDGGQITQERSIGGVATALDAVAKRVGARWVGWTGFERILSDEELAATRLAKRYIPVQAGADLMRGYYDRFSNRYLWPILHGKRSSFRPTQADWAAYQSMNRRFAEMVQKAVRPNDVIWVHDYHLMLVPQYLREAGVTNRIGYFLHVPFPCGQYWMRRPYGRQLAEGIAHANVIGMQRGQDAECFRSYTELANIELSSSVGVFPVGVDYQAYHTAAKRPLVRRLQRAIVATTGGKKIIFSLSRMDYTKGILTQLRAVRRFLIHHKHKHEIVYKLIVAPSREHLPEYTKLSKDITLAVQKINDSLGNADWQPIDYEHRTIGFDEATAWYGAASMLLLLPDADGMNLIAKEYVASRQDDEGMAVLSTSIGAAEQLKDALLVPPRNVAAAASAIGRAIRMTSLERPKRWHAMRLTVRNQDIFWWADNFLTALAAAKPKA